LQLVLRARTDIKAAKSLLIQELLAQAIPRLEADLTSQKPLEASVGSKLASLAF
jgi:hypothetical protein